MSALGQLIYGGMAGSATALTGNTTTTQKLLTQTGTGAASAPPAWNALTSILDTLLGTAEGTLVVRGPSAWQALAPGTIGYALTSNGASALPTYQAVVASAPTLAQVMVAGSTGPATTRMILYGATDDTSTPVQIGANGVVSLRTDGTATFGGEIQVQGGDVIGSHGASFNSTIYTTANNSYIGYNGTDNYLGGPTYFRAASGGPAMATINGATGAATFDSTLTVTGPGSTSATNALNISNLAATNLLNLQDDGRLQSRFNILDDGAGDAVFAGGVTVQSNLIVNGVLAVAGALPDGTYPISATLGGSIMITNGVIAAINPAS